MSLPLFLTSLRDSGRVRVAPPREVTAEERAEALEVLRRWDGDARAEAAGEAPALSEDAALWGAVTLYRATQALVFREIPAEAVKAALAAPCPVAASSEAAWSADLALRTLPDLVSLASGVSEDDPLVEGLRAIARAWPLSGVGVRGAGPGPDEPPLATLEPVLAHPALLRAYVDRVLERGDAVRALDARVRPALREAIGAHPELSPDVAAVLEAVG